ncbi:MAG: hypothetical protein JST40_00095 [Armatimonadetes bacterium]|nr:hypothetical protein [Armatimonadota bacterium]
MPASKAGERKTEGNTMKGINNTIAQFNNFARRALTITALVGAFAAAQAGTFTSLGATDEGIEMYKYSGEMKLDDAKEYAKLLDKPEHIGILIDSPGGQFVAGLVMGELTAKFRDEVTLVVDHAYSAAGLWALADDDMIFLNDKSELGLHLPYAYGEVMTEAQAQRIGHLMGKYLDDRMGDEAGEAIMEKLADIRDQYGKFAMLVINGAGDVKIKK